MKNLAFNQKSLIDSLFYALEVAKALNTRLASFMDLAKIRINTEEDSRAWNRWVTPLITIYFGVYNNKKTIVVAHHLGPLYTKERLSEWANSGDKESGRFKYGFPGLPKIIDQEFADLINGKFGKVSVIDYDEYITQHENLLINSYPDITSDQALADPIFQALFEDELEPFIRKHCGESEKYAKKEHKDPGAEKKILSLSFKDHFGWNPFYSKTNNFPVEKPIAFFMNFGCPMNCANHDLSMSTTIGSVCDLHLAAFVVMTDEKEDIVEIDFEAGEHWKKCLVESNEQIAEFNVLKQAGENYFVQYPKDGESMDSGQIMFPVTKIEKVGEPTFFQAKDCMFFLRYLIDAVKEIAPNEANAYEITAKVRPGSLIDVPIQFYKIEFDSSKRILKREEVVNNLSLLLEINNVSF